MGKSTRDLKQEECFNLWVKKGCRGTIEACTGFGKTRIAIMAIQRFLKKNPGRTVMVVVPTDNLQKQWRTKLLEAGLIFIDVLIINTAVKSPRVCDLLILDEIHLFAANTFITIFQQVQYKIVLGLTATLERLDGKDVTLRKYAPVVAAVPLSEALKNGWVSPFKEYKILLDVDDIDVYKEVNQEFYNHFAFFQYDFTLAMSCTGPKGYLKREWYLKEICKDESQYKEVRKEILAHTFGFVKTLQARKKFINEHPKKIEIANYILEHRMDKKAITFSATVKMAEKIKYGWVLHSKKTKKKNAMTMDEFLATPTGVLNTSKALNQGSDIEGVNLGILLGIDSSKTKKIQQRGRIIRYSPDKEAEIFTLVIKGTAEEEWFRKSNEGGEYITLDEEGLRNLLEGREFTQKKEKEAQMLFRF